MISSFIALIGLAGVMSMVVWQLQATRLNQSNTEAMTLAQRFFEGMIAQDYETIGNGTRVDGNFTLNWTTIESNNCKFVTLDVSWPTLKTTHHLVAKDLFVDDEVDGYTILN